MAYGPWPSALGCSSTNGERLPGLADKRICQNRLVRHPLYLGMFVATIGLAVAFRSLWGMLISLAVFIPAGLWRARLEEEALASRFGEEWENYCSRASS